MTIGQVIMLIFLMIVGFVAWIINTLVYSVRKTWQDSGYISASENLGDAPVLFGWLFGSIVGLLILAGIIAYFFLISLRFYKGYVWVGVLKSADRHAHGLNAINEKRLEPEITLQETARYLEKFKPDIEKGACYRLKRVPWLRYHSWRFVPLIQAFIPLVKTGRFFGVCEHGPLTFAESPQSISFDKAAPDHFMGADKKPGKLLVCLFVGGRLSRLHQMPGGDQLPKVGASLSAIATPRPYLPSMLDKLFTIPQLQAMNAGRWWNQVNEKLPQLAPMYLFFAPIEAKKMDVDLLALIKKAEPGLLETLFEGATHETV